ncbi:MAG: pseudouridine synthase [Leptospiraceae bacterium]|nr:pseudouridine synthase [Leptospiraceae bacterium]MCP5511915.1 pseudouridine synthase [Leptospiraceae bacterium]
MIYIAFNKPYRVLSQFKPMEGKSDLREFVQLKEKPTAIGRLDFDSEGLLLMTDDLSFRHRVTSPSSEIEKEYLVQVEGIPEESDLDKLRKGITTSGEIYLPAKAKIISEPEFLWERNPPIRFRKEKPTSWISVIIIQGKNRQVRKMTAAIGFPTLRLIRLRVGNISLDGLKPSEFRYFQKKDFKNK